MRVWDDSTHTYYTQFSWSITVVIWSSLSWGLASVSAFISCGGSQPVEWPSASSDIYHHSVLTQEHFPCQHNVWTTLQKESDYSFGFRRCKKGNKFRIVYVNCLVRMQVQVSIGDQQQQWRKTEVEVSRELMLFVGRWRTGCCWAASVLTLQP